MHKYWSLLLVVLCISSPFALQAQTHPLAEKTVAVYFSKKGFTYGQPYHHYLSQFVSSAEGTQVVIDDLKTQSLVAIGTHLSSQLAAATGAKETFFLNERPDLARAFVGAYSSGTHQLDANATAFSDVDLVMVINPLTLYSDRVPVVLTRSNRLITKFDRVKVARLNVELWNPTTGQLVKAQETCIREGRTDISDLQFDFQSSTSKTGKFLSTVFSVAMQRLASDDLSNCPEEVDEEDEWD